MTTRAIDLTNNERGLLLHGLTEWSGPARPDDLLARTMGFGNLAEMRADLTRLAGAVASGIAMSPPDWRRVLLATEIVLASDVYGAGTDWYASTGLEDQETIRMLRATQRKLIALTRQASPSQFKARRGQCHADTSDERVREEALVR